MQYISSYTGNVVDMGKHLVPHRHRQIDFFTADLFDASLKDDIHTMQHPVFALRYGDHRKRTYESDGVKIDIKPGFDGLATIHDKDLWIFCISQLIAAKNRGAPISRTVRFTAHEFMIATNRDTGGRSYKLLGDTLDRLRSTSITTNIKTADMREKRGFGLIDSYKIVEKDRNDRMVAIEVTLPDWLFRSVETMQVLTLNPDYFRLRKSLDKRIYEIVRKHCGKQKSWTASVEMLYEKSGSRDTQRKFRAAVKALAESNELPDYRLMFDPKSDNVTFKRRAKKQHV